MYVYNSIKRSSRVIIYFMKRDPEPDPQIVKYYS